MADPECRLRADGQPVVRDQRHHRGLPVGGGKRRIGDRGPRLDVAPRERIAGPPYSVCTGGSGSTGGGSVCWASKGTVKKKTMVDSRSLKLPLPFVT